MRNNKELSLLFQPKEESYSDFIRRLYGKTVKTVTFLLTYDCTLRCSYCYESHKCDKQMRWETAKECIDFLFDAYDKNSVYINEQDAGGLCVDLIGGEPLMRVDLIEQIVQYVLTKEIQLNHPWLGKTIFSISSNGTEYFDKRFQRLMRIYSDVIDISITIDGNKDLHDKCRKYPDGRPSYDKSFAAAKHLADTYNRRGSKLTIAPANLPYLTQACKDIITDLKLVHLNANPIFEKGWTLEDAKLYYNQLKELADWLILTEQYKKTSVALFVTHVGNPIDTSLSGKNDNWCGGTGAMMAFDIDGSIYPCLRFTPISIGDSAKNCQLGDIYRGFFATENQKAFGKHLSEITLTSQSTDECINCPVAEGCAWCSAYNYEATGSVNKRVTYICDMHKARTLVNTYYINTLCRQAGIEYRQLVNLPKDDSLRIISEEEFDMLVRLSEV